MLQYSLVDKIEWPIFHATFHAVFFFYFRPNGFEFFFSSVFVPHRVFLQCSRPIPIYNIQSAMYNILFYYNGRHAQYVYRTRWYNIATAIILYWDRPRCTYYKQTLTRCREDKSASYYAFFFSIFVRRAGIDIAIFVSIDQRPPRRARDKLLAAAATSAMLPEGFDFSPPTGYWNSGPTSRHPAFPLCNVHRKLIGIGPLTRVCNTICLNKNFRFCQTIASGNFFNVLCNIILWAVCIQDRQRVNYFNAQTKKNHSEFCTTLLLCLIIALYWINKQFLIIPSYLPAAR